MADTAWDIEVPADYFRCCALDEEGHDGPCAWVCSSCQGSAKCWVCKGSSDDGSGLDDTCMECMSGTCPFCFEGMEVDE